LPLLKAKGVFTLAKLGPCLSASTDAGYEFFCST
jgi:hypothetical protein